VTLYKEAFHVLRRRLRRVVIERNKLKTELKRIETLRRMEEDYLFSLL
jgi:hypothetical protein